MNLGILLEEATGHDLQGSFPHSEINIKLIFGSIPKASHGGGLKVKGSNQLGSSQRSLAAQELPTALSVEALKKNSYVKFKVPSEALEGALPDEGGAECMKALAMAYAYAEMDPIDFERSSLSFCGPTSGGRGCPYLTSDEIR